MIPYTLVDAVGTVDVVPLPPAVNVVTHVLLLEPYAPDRPYFVSCPGISNAVISDLVTFSDPVICPFASYATFLNAVDVTAVTEFECDIPSPVLMVVPSSPPIVIVFGVTVIPDEPVIILLVNNECHSPQVSSLSR